MTSSPTLDNPSSTALNSAAGDPSVSSTISPAHRHNASLDFVDFNLEEPSSQSQENRSLKAQLGNFQQRYAEPSTFQSQAIGSSAELVVPRRENRNQPSNRVHDIEFAAEISTSLIKHIRNLQVLLTERDKEIMDLRSNNSQLEVELGDKMERVKILYENNNPHNNIPFDPETKVEQPIYQPKNVLVGEELGQTPEVTNTAMQQRIDDLTKQNQDLISQVSSLTADKTQLENQCQSLQQSNTSLNESEHRYKEENLNRAARLRETSSDLDKAVSFTNSVKSSAYKELDRIKGSHASLINQLKDLVDKASNAI